MTHPPRRRWFRWSLRTMFVVVTAAAFLCGWVVYQLNWIRQRRDYLSRSQEWAESLGLHRQIVMRGAHPSFAPIGLMLLREPTVTSLRICFSPNEVQPLIGSNEVHPFAGKIYRVSSKHPKLQRARELFPEARPYPICYVDDDHYFPVVIDP
jgi:hypothetical protein